MTGDQVTRHQTPTAPQTPKVSAPQSDRPTPPAQKVSAPQSDRPTPPAQKVSAPPGQPASPAQPQAPGKPSSVPQPSDQPASHDKPQLNRDRPIHSRYPDGTLVYEGQQPGKVKGPAVGAEGPHTVLARDPVNGRTYKAREYDGNGNPVRDIDFTIPTYPSGRERPNHSAPEEHLYTPNDPSNPKAGYKRGPGQPLRSDSE